MATDIHAKFGLSCADCHGGDRTSDDGDEAMSPTIGFVGRPSPKDLPAFCGKCHSDAGYMKRFNPAVRVDQVAEYATSVHGTRLAGGDTNVATCISCHGVHGISSVKDSRSPVYPTNVASTCGRCHSDPKRMAPYDIPTDQAQKYASSVHAHALTKKQDLTAPTCNDCHGNHGAAPPGVGSVANVCGSCHARQSELFEQSPHKEPFEESSIAGCVACHSNHSIKQPTDALIGTSSASACVACHSEGEDALKVAAVMHTNITRLSTRIDSASALLMRAAHAGMEVSKPLFELKAAHDKLINARVVVHSLNPSDLDSLTKDGEATALKAQKAGTDALEELDFRRTGLIASLIIIALAAISVYAKVRQMERRKKSNEAKPVADSTVA